MLRILMKDRANCHMLQLKNKNWKETKLDWLIAVFVISWSYHRAGNCSMVILCQSPPNKAEYKAVVSCRFHKTLPNLRLISVCRTSPNPAL